jgi:hypothetical protein
MDADELQDRLPEGSRDVEFADRLELFGVAAGGFLLLVGLATVAGTPWTHKASAGASALQVIGALATAAVGAGLIWLVQTQR